MFEKLRRNIERNLFGKDPNYQDPYDDPAEQYYAKIYLKFLFEKIDDEFRRQRVRILDLGCHTGRLSVPLAKAGHEVTGIDSSLFHIKRAQEHARREGVSCEFIRGDGFKRIRHMPPGHFDLVLCTEVLYQDPHFRQHLKDLLCLLRVGGLLATSHRTRFFYLVRAIREGHFDLAQFILSHSEGELWETYFNWQTPAELKQLYQELGTDVVFMGPVGIFSGNGGDGMARLCDLSQLSPSQREALSEIESSNLEEFSAMARYLLVIGRKRENRIGKG